MTFIQKVKIILQLLFISILFLLNAAVYQKYNYFASATHLSYIPRSSVLTVTLNANRLSGKMLYQLIYKNEEITQLLEEIEPSQKPEGNLLNTGIDFTTQLTFVMTHTAGDKGERQDYAGLLLDLNEPDNAIKQLTSRGFAKLKNGIYSSNKTHYAVMNNEVMGIFIFRDSSFSQEKKLAVLENFIQSKDKAVIGQTIAKYLQKGSDAVVYGLPENLMEQDAWMNYFVGYGEFNNDAFDFKIDFNFKRDVTSYFPENQVNEKFNFDDIKGYLYMKTSLYATNASRIIDKVSVFKMNDSLQKIFVPVLHNQLARGFELYGHSLNKAELILPADAGSNMKMLSKNFFLPAFDFRLNCSDPKKIDTLLQALEKQGKIILQPDNWYLWQRDQYYKMYFGLKNDWLNVTTHPDGANQMPQTGYSNVLYFNSDNFNSKLPSEVLRFAANEKKIFDYFLVYSTGVEKNILHTKGKLVLKRETNSLIEGIKIVLRAPEDINDLKSLLSQGH